MTFDETTGVRIDKEMLQVIDYWVKKDPERWPTRSQYVRSAVFKFSRETMREEVERIEGLQHETDENTPV